LEIFVFHGQILSLVVQFFGLIAGKFWPEVGNTGYPENPEHIFMYSLFLKFGWGKNV
jgi:hypothetical protein